ncbi:hypothetical protein KC19_4G169900 [Ceratodon purpureus]|uniref:Uncharacterized protein n=2 Tax=Ceratodon purpureus TaxID=3225 RepID=A0A8T0IC24_CERPU|nr:hypothetical protein KC19_4G169900 [Ceratodon purpureus]KAG0580391.1 hypothetical protein KC19_4G169900 [Ceratodon purpureus]
MEVVKQKAMVKPKPLLLQAVSKVDQVVARLQELQSTIAGSQLNTQSRFNYPSGRMPDLLGRSPKKSSAMDCRVSGELQGSFLKLGRKKGSTSTPERRKSLTLADGWRHWSTPAKDVHDVLSEILLANQLNKRFVNLVGSKSSHDEQFDNVNKSKATTKSSNKLVLDSTSDTENSSKKDLTTTSVNSSLSSDVLEPTVCSSVESLVSTPRTSKPIPLNRRSSSKRGSLRKPPPHLFKVIVGNEGPAAKTGSAVSHRQVDLQKSTEARKITTPSPLYKRRSGTLVQKPVRISGELRSSSNSRNSSLRCSVERKRLTDSASLRRSTEKFVEACRAMMEEEEQLKRANGQATGKGVHFTKSPPIFIRPLLFESPGKSKMKPVAKTHKNWLTNRFSKSSSAKESSILSKPKKIFKSSSRDLPTLISRLPAHKVEPSSIPLSSEPAKVLKETSSGPPSLPLPPARQADNVLKNSARGMALKASKDKKSGYTSYDLEPTVLLSSSRESLAEVDSNSLKVKDRKRCSVGCPPKDTSAPALNARRNDSFATSMDVNLPNYMKPRAGSGPGKENNSKSINITAKHSSGTSLLHRAKDWVSLHKTKDKGSKRLPESSERVAVAT